MFIDESGQDHQVMPCEVLAGISVAEENLWNLIKAIRSAEKDHFGDYLRNLRTTEIKARRFLKRKCFRLANQKIDIPDEELPALAHSFLLKGMQSRKLKTDSHSVTALELTGYCRSVLHFIDKVIDIAANFEVRVFASVVDKDTAATEQDILKKDFVYLFERYFYFLKTLPEHNRGLVVFDELEKSKAQKLIQQMASYFLGTKTGQFRSSKIIPEPFFVHSELTTGVFLADLTAYIIGWGWRLNKMSQPMRPELESFARKLHDMQFVGVKPKSKGDGTWTLYGIKYIEDKGFTEDSENVEL
ncbi:MAG: DUF3800 domain-containing protein [Sedimentisphaerales bacterium]|nr:DUF3800 domain-containing protein [Sedimentisphaerales bacterium]